MDGLRSFPHFALGSLHMYHYQNDEPLSMHSHATPSWCLQDDFLDSLHAQNMESHKHLLDEIGVDPANIPAPDLCLVGVFMGSIGELQFDLSS